jgi:hypothetical protein
MHTDKHGWKKGKYIESKVQSSSLKGAGAAKAQMPRKDVLIGVHLRLSAVSTALLRLQAVGQNFKMHNQKPFQAQLNTNEH